MTLVKSPTELTTAVTDLFLAVEGLFLLLWLWTSPPHDRARAYLGSAIFGLVFLAALLGAMAHGLALRASVRTILFFFIFLSLGMVVVLLALGTLAGLTGWEGVKHYVPILLAGTVVFFIAARFLPRTLPFLVCYEALAYLTALTVSFYLAWTGRLPGAAWTTAALMVGLLGAFVQNRRFTVYLLFPWDQNGIFHLIAMVALAILARGMRGGM